MNPRTAAATIVTAGILVLQLSAAVSTVTGRWWADIDNQTPFGGHHYTFDLKADGRKLTGTVDSEAGRTTIADGRVDGNSVFFVESIVFASDIVRIEYAGTFSGEEIRFTRSIEDYEPQAFVARRGK
jgi:hypothetical protein